MADEQTIKREDLFIKYNNCIYSYEKFIEEIYNKNNNSPLQDKYKGYIIYLSDYEELKKNLNYNSIKQCYSSKNIEKQKLLQHYDVNKFSKIKTIKQIEFYSQRYLINKIKNGNEYIIINEELWNLIGCKNNENKNPSIEFSLENNNQISINFENGENLLIWTNNNNIINKYSLNYSTKKENINYYVDEYKNIIKDINSYYNIEKEFSDILNKKNQNSIPRSGYLINITWINKWKKITNYSKIINYIKSNKESEIQNELIHHLDKNNYKYDELPPLEILSFNSKKEMDEYLENNIIVIIDSNFKSSFKITSNEKITIYNINNNQINISADKDMVFKLYKNIIARNENLNLIFLKQLFTMVNLNIDIKNSNDNQKIYLINERIIENYKKIFNYDKISAQLNYNNISYNGNFKEYYSKIADIILNNEEYMNYIKKIDFIEAFNNIKDDYHLNKNHMDIKLENNQIVSFDYISNITLVNEEILLFLSENNLINILDKDIYLQSEYIYKNDKILLILKDKENKYIYEIGYISSDGSFFIEFIIKEINDKQGIIKNFCNKYSINDLIDNFLKDEDKNQIINKKQLIGYFSKIQNNEQNNNIKHNINNSQENINSDQINNENENFIIKLISLFSSLHSFEKEVKNKLSNFINKNNIINITLNKQDDNEHYFLIHSNFIFQLKSLSNYNQIEQLFDKLNNSEQNIKEILNNKDIINSILLNKNEIISLFNEKNYIIEEKNYENKNIYLDNFYILNNESCNKLYELNNNILFIQKYEINFAINCGKIILKIKNIPENITNNNFYIFIYSLEQQFAEIINYKIYSLLVFSDINELNNTFSNLINVENLLNCVEQTKNNNNKFQYILIDKNESENKNVDEENFYILYNIILFNEYLKIEQNAHNEKLFLINRNYMKELESILCFNDIKQILLNNNQINTMNIYQSKEEKQAIVKNIKNLLNENITKEIQQIKKENVEMKLNSINFLNIQSYPYENNNIFYFNNCQVITEKLCSLIQKFVPNFQINSECFINNKNIFSKLNDDTICIGDLTQDNLFQVKYIIYSKDISYMNNIMNKLRISGISSLQNEEFPSHLVIINLLDNKVINKNNIENTSYNLSNKILALIYLSYYSQKKLIEKNNTNIRVILLNKKFLFHFYYDKICSLINQMNFQNEPTNINEIISKLDINILSKIDQSINNASFNDIPILAQSEIYKLSNKSIKIYKDFLLVKFDCFQTFLNKFYGNQNINIDSNEQIGYFYKQKENMDIIFIANINNDNYNLFIGQINEENNYYDIKFILDFNSPNILKEQKNLLTNLDLNNYFQERIIFSQKDENDLISPIIHNNNIVGNCYKCIINVNDYSQSKDYTLLLQKNTFKETIKLYYNYQKIYHSIKSNKSNIEVESYFLVNKSFISAIKQELNFMEFCSYLNKGKVFSDNDINIYNTITLLKETPIDILKKFFGNNGINPINQYNQIMEIGIIPIKYFNNNDIEKCIMIYNDFELIEEKTIELFVDINLIKNYSIKCIINEGKIILLYPSKFDQEKRCIATIGKISDELNYITEYILVYDDDNIRKQHIESIYGGINNFINNLHFVNHCQPIHDNKYNIVGTVIDYAQYDSTSNINTPVNIPSLNNNNNSINLQFPIFNMNNTNQSDNIFTQNNNNIQNPNEINKINKIKNDITTVYIYPTLIGLQNIGATCYMNATLQCFCHIVKFVNFFKYSKQAIEIYEKKEQDKLSYSFKILIEELWTNKMNTNKTFYAPYDFKQKISKMNSLFEGVAANDSKDLVNFIIMTLHEELNKANKNSNNIEDNLNLDQRNKDLVFQIFMKNFTEKNRSIISDLFYGVNCNIIQCQNPNCLSRAFNYQIYFFLVFPLEEVRKFKLQYNPNSNELVNIYDCFQYNQKSDLMTGDNAMYCNYCRLTCNSIMQMTLTVGPEILILILNRGQGIQFKIKLNFYEDLDLENFIEHKETGAKYKLIGVITHLGDNDMSGHFIAYCKDPISNSWYQFNDALVNPVKNFQNDVIDFAMPYLLFYQKVN